MGDQDLRTETQAPNAEVGQPAEQPATEQAQEQPFAVFKDAKAFNQRLDRETRKRLNESAKQAGFDDWQHMQESLAALRQPPAKQDVPENPQGAPEATPAPANVQTGTDEAQRLRMALSVASELNLPTALVMRLQGSTPEEMKADAQQLLGLFQQPRSPGIPQTPRPNGPTTYTRAQLQNPAFVREHMADIRRAAAEGRIVDG